MPRLRLFALLLLSTCFFYSNAFADAKFPERDKFPNVKYIELQQLYEKKDNVLIVDTRSKYEYNTLHIRNAVNVPVSALDFSSKIRDLYNQHKKTIVFYCNGHSCVKSYNAVLKAKMYAKVDDTVAFDAGIFDWVTKYPEESVLLEQAPAKKEQLISKEQFSKHLLKPKAFLKRSNDECIILDIRDSSQRTDHIFAGYEKSVSLDDTLSLDQYIDQSLRTKKPLCVYDAVGGQVRWLQYYLERKKLKEYYFLDGGAKAFFETPYKELHN